ncbi:MAG: glycosyltransferase [Solirubrobacteraceae bacterium]|jgi:glycosyltransferase involved in cell wall biosynthesis
MSTTVVAAPIDTLRELVVCSLEPWDETWRRNQFLVDALMREHPRLRVLFVEPAADPLFDLAARRRPLLGRSRDVRGDQRLEALRPLKPLPRRLGEFSDRSLRRSVVRGARRLGFERPVLWINDVTYAPLIAATGWPAVYDITDDWLLAGDHPAELRRLVELDTLALERAQAVVVCSAALAASRGRNREVELIPNAVDAAHFRRTRPRPPDLPPAPVAVYLGTLHDARIDVGLVIELARARRDLSVALVGPDALGPAARAALAEEPNIVLLGPRPYRDAPAYLQHADVVIVPHLVSPFTESLDPIKAHESLAIATPTVATPVAGFRELAGAVDVVQREVFVATVEAALVSPTRHERAIELASWAERAARFGAVLTRIVEAR